MRTLNLLVTAIVVLSCPLSARPDEHGDSKDAGFFVPDEIKWQEGPKSLPTGAKLAVLEGDPTKEGYLVMLLRLPDGYSIPPHTHPNTERLTVISGTFNIAMGEKLDKQSGRKMPAGTFGF
jgi:anti-sigma factor ChrR (cupin superfamily)